MGGAGGWIGLGQWSGRWVDRIVIVEGQVGE